MAPTVKLPAKYSEARLPALPSEYKAAVAAMSRLNIAEAKAFKIKADTLAAYAYKAKDVSLVEPAITTKKVAERRIGELIAAAKAEGNLAKGTRGSKVKGARVDEKPTLASQGVDKNLADRARKAAAMSEDRFVADLNKTIKIAVAAIQHHTEVIKAARAERHRIKKERRDKRIEQLADKVFALPDKKYCVIYADPEWRWEAWSEKGLDATSADNHYRTSMVEAIKARDVPSICCKDAVLFLWATVPMLPQALEVMDAWGFHYVSNFAWVKDKHGTGYWSRNKHELLLIGTRGHIPAPLEGTQWDSVIEAPRSKHSEKPDKVYRRIERLYPGPYLELFARKERDRWWTWGNEVAAEAMVSA